MDIEGIITGDGADELFAGYRFLIKKVRDMKLKGRFREFAR